MTVLVSRHRPHLAALVAVTLLGIGALAAGTGCSESDSSRSPFVITDGVGTGSHGGNPFVLAFDTTGATDGVLWTGATFEVAEARMATFDASGACAIDAAEWVPVQATIGLGQLRAIAADQAPCAIDMRPDPAEALLRGEARVTIDGVEVDLAIVYPLVDGLRLSVTDPARVETLGGAVLVIDRSELLAGLDLSAPPSGLDLILFDAGASDAARTVLMDNLARATRVYVDPDPSDGRLTADERVESNIAATFSAL